MPRPSAIPPSGKTVSFHLPESDYKVFHSLRSKNYPGHSDGALAKKIVLSFLEKGAMGDARVASSEIALVREGVLELLQLAKTKQQRRSAELDQIKDALLDVKTSINKLAGQVASATKASGQATKPAAVEQSSSQYRDLLVVMSRLNASLEALQ